VLVADVLDRFVQKGAALKGLHTTRSVDAPGGGLADVVVFGISDEHYLGFAVDAERRASVVTSFRHEPWVDNSNHCARSNIEHSRSCISKSHETHVFIPIWSVGLQALGNFIFITGTTFYFVVQIGRQNLFDSI